MKFNTRIWSWLLSLMLYIAALYSGPSIALDSAPSTSKETISKACVFSVNGVLKLVNSQVNQANSSANTIVQPFWRTIDRLSLKFATVKGLWMKFFENDTFVVRALCTLRMKFAVYPFQHHW